MREPRARPTRAAASEQDHPPITLDGDLSDAGWQQATVIDRFYETSPGDNTEPKVRTVAYLAYDDCYFYIGVRADGGSLRFYPEG